MKPLFARIKKLFTEDPILTRVLKNTSYLFSATSLSLLLSMIQSIFAARLLGVAAFGLVGIVTSFVSTVNRIFSFRMGEFIVRYLGKGFSLIHLQPCCPVWRGSINKPINHGL